MIAFVCFVSLAVGLTYLVAIKQRPLRRVLAIYEGAWHLPLVLYVALPFTPKFSASPADIAAVLCLVQLVPLPSVLYASTRPRWRAVGSCESVNAWWLRNRRSIGVVWTFAVISVLFLGVDLFYIRGLHLLDGIFRNRQIYDNTTPSVFGYLAYLGEGAGLLLVGLVFTVSARRRRLILLVPFGLLSALNLVVGVRQYFLFGLISLVVGYAASEVKTRKLAVVVGATAIAFSAAMVGYTILRQPATVGKQVQFVESIGGFTCSNTSACDESRAAIMLNYLYQYVGNEYIGFTAAVRIPKSARSPLLSQTLPFLYRRLQAAASLPPYNAVRAQRLSEVQEVTGFYPNFWKTMYADAFAEGGWIECLALSMISALLLLFCTVRLDGRRSPLAYAQFVAATAALTFGVMYIPTRETFVVALALALVLVRVRMGPLSPKHLAAP